MSADTCEQAGKAVPWFWEVCEFIYFISRETLGLNKETVAAGRQTELCHNCDSTVSGHSGGTLGTEAKQTLNAAAIQGLC